MKIKVEYKNEFLGGGVFWVGDSQDIDSIPNIPARHLARAVLLDTTNKFLTSGMWTVSKYDEKAEEAKMKEIKLQIAVVPMRCAGKLANGAERGKGRLFHAVQYDPSSCDLPIMTSAICGARPRIQWVDGTIEQGVTCKKCLNLMKRGLDITLEI